MRLYKPRDQSLMRVFIIFSEQERRHYKMRVKIVCLILLVQASIDFVAPMPNQMHKIRFQRDGENGSGDSCCVRLSKTVRLKSPDVINGDKSVDVGQCAVQCDSSDASANDQSQPITVVCGGSAKVCVPKHTSYRTYHLDTGPITKEIIKECQCQGTPEGCKRRKRFITYFEGTSFEQAIDIGQCLGVCRGYGIKKQCIATVNKTEVLSGPNGKICVTVIKSCECKDSCYRVPLKEQYSEIYTENGQTKQRWKTIDIGRCMGYCKPSNSSESDLCSDDPELRNLGIPCLEGKGTPQYCVPTKYASESFISSHQQTKNISRIIECGCKE